MIGIPVDAEALAACSREPIHLPGAIQPFGALLVFDEADLTCVQVSANAFSVFALSPESLLGRPISEILDLPLGNWEEILRNPSLASPFSVQVGVDLFDVHLHRSQGLLLADLEQVALSAGSYHRRLQSVFASLRDAADLSQTYEMCARFIGEITGYERVMVYRFSEDWHGEVVGEHLSAPVDSYMGHHFPASDIPDQARALYARSWLRIIPDVNYIPVFLIPADNPITKSPLDLSGSVLRSVSPIHLEYLRNMDVGASMSISLLVDGKLWGLIACHHRHPRPLSFAVRSACELFGQVASLEIAAKQENRRLAEHMQATAIQTSFFDVISREQNVVQALVKYTPSLLEFMGATGAVISVNGEIIELGETPDRPQIESLLAWIQARRINPVFTTDTLSDVFPEASAFQKNVSGLLAVKLSSVEENYILWFRPEVITTITWAGNPQKPNDPDHILHPRKSFAAWTQEVTGRSLPWSDAEMSGARELRAALNALVLRRNERLMNLNSELEKKNTDLNSFAYIAAHDLREPLRGIANYSAFIQEDFTLPPEARRKLETISSLAHRSDQLLDSLNRFSRLGRMEITRTDQDLNILFDETLENLGELIRGEKVEIRRTARLPVVSCDLVLLREVLANLIANAIRYNTAEDKWVEIGLIDDGLQPVFFVRDNGIGIREKHHDSIFNMFRRLHALGEFGTGLGAGLAIVRSIIERHGGRIWVESEYGQGSTFFFTLQ